MDRVMLPPAAWRTRGGVVAVAQALGAATGEARFVGGAVRDALLGIAADDVDLATTHEPPTVIARLEAAGLRAVPTGLAHGTVTAVAHGTAIEVTTLRRDVETDGRRATIAYTTDWREDAARRDFTINALYADPATGEVFDWFGGLADLAAARVRFIGDPYARIAEDHLRILRFFRFHARFGATIDDAGLAACVARANDLMALSRERIAAELLKLLVAPGAVPVMALMVERGVLRAVLPEITDTAPLARLAALELAEGVPPDAIRRLAALLRAADTGAVAARLKLSNADRRRLIAAHDGPGTEGPRALAYRTGPAIATDRLLLAGETVAPLAGWVAPRLPLSGGDLIARGVARGPAVARILKAVEREWIARGFPDADATGAIADQLLRSASSA